MADEVETILINNADELSRAIGRRIKARISPYLPCGCVFEGPVDGDGQAGFLIKGTGVGMHEHLSYRDQISNLSFQEGIVHLSSKRKLATYHPKTDWKLYNEKKQKLKEANLL